MQVIRLTSSAKISYQMLNQIVVLLMLDAILMLLSAIANLPQTSFSHLLSSEALSHLSIRMLHLTILTGIVTAGQVMQLINSNDVQWERRLYYLWWVFIAGTLILGGLDFAPILDVAATMLLLGYLLCSNREPTSDFLRVWQASVVLVIACLLAQFFVTGIWITVLSLFRVYVVYGVAGVSVMFWLMTSWSTVTDEWAQYGVYNVARFIALAGVGISLAPTGIASWMSIVWLFMIPISYVIFAGHGYRALKQRNLNQSLSPHWVAITIVFWLISGFVGTLTTQADLHRWIQGTTFQTMQLGLMVWGMLAITLSLVNYTAAYLRGENRRVTGYMPLWLISFGNGFALIVQACIAVVEIYLSRILQLEHASIAILLIPLKIIWIVCLIGVSIGIALYAIGYWVRRPKILTTSD